MNITAEKYISGKTALLLFFLLLGVSFSGCQTIKSNLRTEITSSVNPSLWLLQFLTAGIRNQEGQWPAAEADYQRMHGDSVSTYFQGKELIFRNQHDTLTIFYSILNKDITEGAYIEFTGEITNGQLSSDSVRYHFNSFIQHTENTKRFQANQGTITFYQNSDKSISVVHTFAHGVAQTTIKPLP